MRARRRPTARVVWAIPPTSCVPHRAAATCGAGLRRRGDGVPRARRRVDTASAEATGLALAVHRPGVWSMLAPPACKTSSRAPDRAQRGQRHLISHVRGGSCPRARPAPRVRVVSVRGHRPLLSTVQTTPCASRGAGRRACWPPGAGGACVEWPLRRAGRLHRRADTRTHHASHPPTINRI